MFRSRSSEQLNVRVGLSGFSLEIGANRPVECTVSAYRFQHTCVIGRPEKAERSMEDHLAVFDCARGDGCTQPASPSGRGDGQCCCWARRLPEIESEHVALQRPRASAEHAPTGRGRTSGMQRDPRVRYVALEDVHAGIITRVEEHKPLLDAFSITHSVSPVSTQVEATGICVGDALPSHRRRLRWSCAMRTALRESGKRRRILQSVASVQTGGLVSQEHRQQQVQLMSARLHESGGTAGAARLRNQRRIILSSEWLDEHIEQC